MVESWIGESNLVPWLEILASYVEYELDSSDIDAISHGIRESDSEKNRFFSYSLSGKHKLSLRVAVDPGTEVLFVRVHAPKHLMPKIEAATDICAEYALGR